MRSFQQFECGAAPTGSADIARGPDGLYYAMQPVAVKAMTRMACAGHVDQGSCRSRTFSIKDLGDTSGQREC
jgi:hypothetical protein